MRSTLIVLLQAGALCAVGQTPAAHPAGVPAQWDVGKMLDALRAQTARLAPLLTRMQPEVWVKAGAPYAYVEQKGTAQSEVEYFNTSAKRLAQDPDKLSLALDTYFRLEALENELVSLIGGVRRYDNPATAEIMQAVVDEGSRNTNRFRQYLTDLASEREAEYKVMDREAQRCRGVLSRQPASKASAN